MGVHARWPCPAHCCRCTGTKLHRRRRCGGSMELPCGDPALDPGTQRGLRVPARFRQWQLLRERDFLITDWFAHTPREVLAKNFGLPESAFANIPTDVERRRWIFAGEVPGPIAADTVKSPAVTVPSPYIYRLLAQEPVKVAGGRVRIVDSHNFPAATTIAAALVEVEPGGLRELHWHPNTDEWQYYINGSGRMTVFASSGRARTFDYQAGDVGFVPFAMGHYIGNTGTETLRFLEMFRSSYFADVSLNQWMALTTPKLVQAHLNLDQQTMAALSKDKPVIVGPL